MLDQQALPQSRYPLSQRTDNRSSLLLLVSGLLLFYLSGGFPPLPWIMLFQLVVQEESAPMWLYALSIFQSLSVCIVWSLFVWAVVHEVRTIINIHNRLQQTIPITLANDILGQVLSQAATNQPALPVLSSQRSNQEDALETPRIIAQNDPFPDNPFEEPGTNQGSYLVAQNAHQHPFDVQNDVYAVFRGPHPAYSTVFDASGRIQPEEPEDTAGEEESPFRFGNPFEGSLPEVFTYDVDLRRSVLEIEAEVKKLETGPLHKNQLET